MFYNIIFFRNKKDFCARIRCLWAPGCLLLRPPPASSSLIASNQNPTATVPIRYLTADPRVLRCLGATAQRSQRDAFFSFLRNIAVYMPQ